MNKLLLLLTVSLSTAVSHADFLEFEDRDAWFDAVPGGITTIGFGELPEFTFITDQYLELGVLFVDGDDQTIFDPVVYPQDGWGLDGQASIHLQFTQPMQWIAADFPGGLEFELFREGELIYASGGFGLGGVGNFGGVIADEPFDEVLIDDWLGDDPFLDDLHFGPPIPAPATLVLLGAALLPGRRRRWSSRWNRSL
jgi:hypothetical protein